MLAIRMAVQALLTVSLGMLAASFAAAAQQPAKFPRIGILTLASASSTPLFEAFRQGLREHGYVEGQNIALEYRFAPGEGRQAPRPGGGTGQHEG